MLLLWTESDLPTTVSLNPWPITPIFECPPTAIENQKLSVLDYVQLSRHCSDHRGGHHQRSEVLERPGDRGDCSRRPMRVTCWSQPRSLV